jgi:hypothetical protein
MTVAEKLRLIKENMTRVYEAGIKLGTETSGLLNVSLLDLNAEGNVVAHTGTIKNITDKSVLVGTNVAEVDIFISGYVEFSLHLTASAYAVVIDGKEYHANAVDEPFKAEDTVHFSGKVLDKIRISGYGFEDITFEYFVKGAIAIEEIFNNGQLSGELSGIDSEWNKLWDDIQDFGNRTAYNNGFQNAWSDDIFQPKYDFRPTSAGYMFAGTKIANLKKCLEDNGVVLDTSNATSLDYMFSNATNFTHCPVISGVKESYFTSTFYNCKKLISIDKFILKDDGSQTFSNDCFQHCSELVEIRIEGAIGNNINFQWSKKLSMMSLASIVSALLKTVTGKTITLPNTARETYDAATYPGRWDEIVAEYPNWTFKYA